MIQNDLLLECRHVSVTPPGTQDGSPYPPALRDISFSLRKGQHTALLGGNGAGKSTFLRLLRGEERPDAGGWIRWYGPDGPEEAPLAGRALATLVSPRLHERYVQQGWRLHGLELLLSGLDDSPLYYRTATKAQEDDACALARELGAEALLSVPATAFSQGQLRLLLLGRALLRRPALLLLDEFDEGLDARFRERAYAALFRRLGETTVVLTTHRRQSLPDWLARVLFLQEGRLSMREPADSPRNLYDPALLRRVPAPGGREQHGSGKACLAPAAGKAVALPPVLTVRNATVFVDRVEVLHQITWTMRQGEHWQIQGDNGAGKSTLLRLLAGDAYPAAGGHIDRCFPRRGRLERLEELRTAIRLVSDREQALYGYDVTALELILSGFDGSVGLYREFSQTERQEAAALLEHFGMAGWRNRRIRRLSSGQLRRVFLARSLAGSPEVLLLDEPCSGLDSPARAEYMRLLEELPALGVQLVIVSHHQEDCPSLIQCHATLHEGILTAGR